MDETDDLFGDPETPPLCHVDRAPPVRTPAELLVRWRQLMGPGGFHGRSLWLIWFDGAGFQLPLVVPVDDVGEHPDRPFLDGLARLLSKATPRGVSVAMALSRPGPAGMLSSDRRWGRALYRCARDLPRAWAPHLATPGRVRPLTADDLGVDLLAGGD